MADTVYRGHHVIIHEGPMADRRGTDWREDAAKLEALDEERIESPQRTLPNDMTTRDLALAMRAKGTGGTLDKTASGVGGDHFEVR